MLRLLLLLPLVGCVPLKPDEKNDTANNILNVEDGILKGVQLKGDAITELDLSDMKLRGVEKNALDNLLDLKLLSLANNSLESLPDFVFSNLTRLEHLSLAENKISDMKYLFVGLENLRVLNISHNPVAHVRRGYLFGLPRTAVIHTAGNIFWSISTDAFVNIFLKDEEQPKSLVDAEAEEAVARNEGKSQDGTMELDVSIQRSEATPMRIADDVKIKLCMSEGIVTSLDLLEKDGNLAAGCTEVTFIDRSQRIVSLRGLTIMGFQEGWYKLQSIPVATLDLSNNDISEITKETLNDLPESVIYVNLLENRIRRIWSQVIENQHLRMLNLKENIIQVIEEGAFQKTKLTGLFLAGNQLENLNFVSSLPDTLTEMVLIENQITSIPDGAFLKLSKLLYLTLADNQITQLKDNAFKGLDSLQALDMTKNKLSQIEPLAFKDLKQLRTLQLQNNQLNDLKRGTFSELKSLKDLSLASNQFVKITRDTFGELPQSLDFLHLDNNGIESLETSSFVEVPRFRLSLSSNKLSAIPQGAFNLPTLQELHLNNNTFTTMDGHSFDGLPQLKRLWMSENKLEEIPKGACKYLNSVNILDISRNPFKRLENGAFYGLSQAKGNYVYIYENHLEEMEGGVFDEA